jgi:hypothetical protein
MNGSKGFWNISEHAAAQSLLGGPPKDRCAKAATHHPSDQYIAFVDTETGDCGERAIALNGKCSEWIHLRLWKCPSEQDAAAAGQQVLATVEFVRNRRARDVRA